MPVGAIQSNMPCRRNTISEGHCVRSVHHVSGALYNWCTKSEGFHVCGIAYKGDITSEGYANGVLCHKGPMMSAPYHQWDATWQGAFPSVHNHCVSLGVRFVLLVVTVSVTTATPTD